MVSLTYIPSDRRKPVYQKELFVPKGFMKFTTPRSRDRFELEVPGLCSVKVHPDSTTEYSVSCEEYTFRAITMPGSREPWFPGRTGSTPEGWLIRLPLPLHWHVHSLCSAAKFSFQTVEEGIVDSEDAEGVASVHQEKNWAVSFPAAHIWLQACPPPSQRNSRPEHTLALAGGKILGMQAYLIGYRCPNLVLEFRPPFALEVFGKSPFLSTKISYPTRSIEIDVQNFTHRLRVRATIDREDWSRSFGISAPFSDGHRQNALAQNLCAKVEVQVWMWKGSWLFGSWQQLLNDSFEHAALEFGADWYGDVGGGHNLGIVEIGKSIN